MNKVFEKMALTAGVVKHQAVKYSPEIFLTLGIGGFFGAVAFAIKATKKTSDILDERDEDIEKLKSAGESDTEINYICKNVKKEIAKQYAPVAVLTLASTGCVLGSYGVLKKRNAALIAAYATLERTYAEYRERVKKKYGEEAERAIHYDIQEEAIENPETGEEETVKTTGYKRYSDYAFFFDESCPDWTKDPEFNKHYVNGILRTLNDILCISRYKRYGVGWLFLNELYREYGSRQTKAGQFVGWIYDPDHKLKGDTVKRDGYIKLGIYDDTSERSRAFVNGYERSILLDPNVDGVIVDIVDEITTGKYKN